MLNEFSKLKKECNGRGRQRTKKRAPIKTPVKPIIQMPKVNPAVKKG